MFLSFLGEFKVHSYYIFSQVICEKKAPPGLVECHFKFQPSRPGFSAFYQKIPTDYIVRNFNKSITSANEKVFS